MPKRLSSVPAVLFFLMSPLVIAQDAIETGKPAVRDSVVKVHSTRRAYLLSSPWRRGTSGTVTGSGVVVAGDRILTNFHVVASSVDVSVSLNGTSEKLSASIEVVSPEMDLAIIKLDEAPPEGTPAPLTIAEQCPPDGTKVQVLGFPKGGDSLSVTEGVSSRLEHVGYRYEANGLRLQIDAPINSGNSGGPVVADDKVVGITFGGLSAANDVGYAIPAEEIQIFLADVEDGSYDGKPQTWWFTQSLRPRPLRSWLKVPDNVTGIRFCALAIPVEDYPLQINDVITHIGAFDVSNSGQVETTAGRSVSYRYAIDQSVKDGELSVKILRDGKEMELSVPVFQDANFLLKSYIDKQPEYFVHGPLVFGVASTEYFATLDSMRKAGGKSASAANALFTLMHATGNPYWLRRYERVKDDEEQLVVLSKILSHKMTRDVKVLLPATVAQINGVEIANIRHAADVIRSLDSDQIVIELDDDRRSLIVFDRDELESVHDELMEENGIVRSSSKGLKAE